MLIVSPHKKLLIRERMDYAEDVVILVDEAQKRVIVHKKILCSSSEFFKTSCSNVWQEKSEDNHITLPETKFDIFMIYVNWLYTRSPDVAGKPEDQDMVALLADDRESVVDPIHENIIQSFIFGDFIGDKTYCNTLTDKLIKFYRDTPVLPHPDHIEQSWTQLREGSGMPRLLVDIYVGFARFEDIDELFEDLPHDFVLKVTKVLMQTRGKDFRTGRPAHQPRCHYHEHEGDADKCEYGDRPWSEIEKPSVIVLD